MCTVEEGAGQPEGEEITGDGVAADVCKGIIAGDGVGTVWGLRLPRDADPLTPDDLLVGGQD